MKKYTTILIIVATIALVAVVYIFNKNITNMLLNKGASPAPTASSPYYEQEAYQKAVVQVAFDLPYKKDSYEIKYLPQSQMILASINAASAEDYRNQKKSAEKFFAKYNTNICDLHIGWTPNDPDGKYKYSLKQEDFYSTNCPAD